LLALLVAGCATSVTDAYPRVRHDAAVLEWGLLGQTDVQTLDPALASDPTSITVSSLVYGGLVRLDPHLRVIPDGASSWSISRDGRIYTFHIRPDLRFADGQHVTAQDFASALNRALGPEGAAGTASFYLGLIAPSSTVGNVKTHVTQGIRVVDPATLQITLTHPAAHFLAELAFPVSFVPDPAVMTRYGSSWTDHAAGFGPFVVRDWQHTRFLRLVRNPYYYAGAPALKEIVIHFYGDSSALSDYRSGLLDVVSGLQAGQILPSTPFGTRRIPALALDYLAFNATRLPFHRLNARRAFSSEWEPAFAGVAMGPSAFAARGFPPSALDIQVPAWQPTLSGRIYLARAQYPRARGFPPVTLVLPRDQRLYLLASELQQAWKAKLGVAVTVRQLNTSNYEKVLSARAFDLALVRWGSDYPDPQDFLGTQLGSSSDNVTGWTRAAYDQAVRLADSYSPRDARRLLLFGRAAKFAAQKLPILPLDEPAQTAVIRPDLTGISLTPLGTITGDWAHARLRS
jgi:ABC-type oligopeptide transport system substrate-binding subunit